MKLTKCFLLMTTTLVVGSQAFADPAIGGIYNAGLVHIKALKRDGVKIPHNPIVCFNGAAGVTLIYSHDFRHDGTVLLIIGDNLTKVSKNGAAFVELETPSIVAGMVQQTRITFQGHPFTCESSLIQLERVGG